MPTMIRSFVITFVLLLAGFAASAGATTADPWLPLSRLRLALESAGAQEMSFEQTFVPAGFTTGETESGTVFLDLPGCIRWDYLEPYPKSFLLCGTELHAWNPGEGTGQLYALDETQPGLDLLLLDRPRLEETYHAIPEKDEEGEWALTLKPRLEDGRALASATIGFTPEGQGIREIRYEDREGNRTRFRFGPARPVAANDLFRPPPGLRWERETP